MISDQQVEQRLEHLIAANAERSGYLAFLLKAWRLRDEMSYQFHRSLLREIRHEVNKELDGF